MIDLVSAVVGAVVGAVEQDLTIQVLMHCCFGMLYEWICRRKSTRRAFSSRPNNWGTSNRFSNGGNSDRGCQVEILTVEPINDNGCT